MANYQPMCTPENCLVSSGIVDIEQASELSCPVVARVNSTLHDVFGYTDFRPCQFKAAVAALHGHDVFVQMSTGGGKSLCMFLPILSASDASIGVVISPLNAIMDEQVCICICAKVEPV